MQGPTCIFWANLTPFSLQLATVVWALAKLVKEATTGSSSELSLRPDRPEARVLMAAAPRLAAAAEGLTGLELGRVVWAYGLVGLRHEGLLQRLALRAVGLGLGRMVALHYRASTLYQTH